VEIEERVVGLLLQGFLEESDGRSVDLFMVEKPSPAVSAVLDYREAFGQAVCAIWKATSNIAALLQPSVGQVC